MPMPEGAQLTFGINQILTNVALNFLPSIDSFIGPKVFPTVPSGAPSGLYNVWSRGDFLRRNGKRIANYESVPLGGFKGAQQNFSVKNWGVGTPYTQVDLANAVRGGQTVQQFKNNKTRWCVTQGVLEMEFRVQALIQTAANWSTTIAGVAANPTQGTNFLCWDVAGSTPVDDIKLWKRKMRQLTGFVPNTLVIPEAVMLVLQKNAQIISRVTPGYYGAGQTIPVQVSEDQIAVLFGIPNIWTPLAMYNAAAEGQADNLIDIWNGNIVWMGYVASAPSADEPSAGYNFSWTGNTQIGLPAGVPASVGPQMLGAIENDQGLFMREYIDMPKSATIIESMLWTDPNVVGAALGMTWTNVLNVPY